MSANCSRLPVAQNPPDTCDLPVARDLQVARGPLPDAHAWPDARDWPDKTHQLPMIHPLLVCQFPETRQLPGSP